MKKSRANLLRSYADVVDMCEGTNVLPNQCVRLDGIVFLNSNNPNITPTFTRGFDDYSFAISLVHGHPAWVGDKFWVIGGSKNPVTLIGVSGGHICIGFESGLTMFTTQHQLSREYIAPICPEVYNGGGFKVKLGYMEAEYNSREAFLINFFNLSKKV